MSETPLESLAEIDKWFKAHCDDLWEHHNGLSLTTTDNPGWLITIDQAIDETAFDNLKTKVSERWNAECVLEHLPPKDYAIVLDPPPVQVVTLKKPQITVYAVSLENCISATAYILVNCKATL